MNSADLFLSCDWGTSRFRLRLADLNSYQILAEVTSADGVARLASENTPDARAEKYRQVLQKGVSQLQAICGKTLADLPIILSGMASSSLGWKELPYAELPFALSGTSAVWENLGPLSAEHKSEVYLLSGVRSDEDVMRGEETEALGAWSLAPEYVLEQGALVILPGTHSKHVSIRQGEILEFHTYMTGELFEVLSTHSVLRHSLPSSPTDGDNSSAAAWPEVRQAFQEGVHLGAERPLENALFLVRTGSLLSGRNTKDSAALLSGILIGSELAILRDSQTSTRPILLCASGELALRYQASMEALSLSKSLLLLEESLVAQMATRGQALLLQSIRRR